MTTILDPKESSQSHIHDPFRVEQRKDASLQEMRDYLELLPGDDERPFFNLHSSQVLYFIDPRQKSRKRAAVPE